MRLLTAIYLASMAVLASTSRAYAACVPVDHSSALRPYVAGLAEPLMFRSPKDRQIRWAAERTEAPPDGILYVFDCSGRQLDAMPLGFVQRFRNGPKVGGYPTVEARFVQTAGSGISATAVAILQFRGGRLHKLWSHETAEMILPPLSGPQAFEDRYRWRSLSPDRIEVTGIRIADGEAHSLPREVYCYAPSVASFERCS